jgi:CelD/BcsL family acetyltransferase involved in cellulose biosynthesis
MKRGLLSVEILYNQDVFSLLRDTRFRSQWDDLYHRCLWATGFQSIDFAQTWYDIYRGDYCPLLVLSPGIGSNLTGLLPLGIDRSGEIVACGAWQAEYQSWLFHGSEGPEFILQAIRLVREKFPNKSLTFNFLPPLTPANWVRCIENNFPSRVRTFSRPIMGLENEQGFIKSLMKKSNRSRINRLKKSGEIRFERITDPDNFSSVLEDVIGFYDLRQGAMSDVLPFKNDQHKRAFHMALLEKQNLLHVTVLYSGDQVISAHLGICSKDMVHLGIIAHSPFEARHSPGKLHILFLSKMLKEEGYKGFDLTPSGDYKDRFATTHDRVYSLTVFGSEQKRRLATITEKSRSAVSRGLRAFEIDPEAVKSFIVNLRQDRPWRIPLRLAYLLIHKVWHSEKYVIYRIDLSLVQNMCRTGPAMRDSVADLLKYVPGRVWQTRKDFLLRSMKRLERGEDVYTFAKDDSLLFCCWMTEGMNKEVFDELHHSVYLPKDTPVVYDFVSLAKTWDGSICLRILQQIVQEAAMSFKVKEVYIVIPEHNRAVNDAIENLDQPYHALELTDALIFRRRK